MLTVKVTPVFSDDSLLQSLEDVAWQFRGEVVDGQVLLIVDDMIKVLPCRILCSYEIVKHILLQFLAFGLGVEGCEPINKDFQGGWGDEFRYSSLYSQLEQIYVSNLFTGYTLESYSFIFNKFEVLQRKALSERDQISFLMYTNQLLHIQYVESRFMW